MDQSHLQQLHNWSRWYEPSALLLVDGGHGFGDGLFMEPYSFAWKRQSVLDLDADFADRYGRNIRGSRLDLVLRVL